MNTIVPLNIAAIRVSPTDTTNVIPSLKGRVANFDNMPFGGRSTLTSTGDTIVQRLESTDTALAPLYTGIHLHWELPDFFRKGVQEIDSNQVVFPQVPNRWLVVRYLSLYDSVAKTWGPVTNYSWIIESDYISMEQLKDSDGIVRPSVPVPLPVNPTFGANNQPYRFMGRVVPATNWPATSPSDRYLADFKDVNNENCYLTSVGFLGPGFSAYYPDCCTVFGFSDRFLDNPTIYNALQNNTAIQFKATYQVTGWIANGKDPMDGLATRITTQYKDYVANCRQQQMPINRTPADFFHSITNQIFKWQFGSSAVSFTVDDDKNLTSLTVPNKTICSGLMQEVVWNMLQSPGSSGFLGSPETPTAPGIWQDKNIKLAVGNNSIEALAALLKYDNVSADSDTDTLNNYEYLLDALQLGILNDLETDGSNIIELEEVMHTSGFAGEQGGLQWMVQQKAGDPNKPVGPVNPNAAITLPLNLAEQLHLLNQAQKDYDMGRKGLSTVRSQLYMDWYRYIKMFAGDEPSPNVDSNRLFNFLNTGSSSALSLAVNMGNDTGIVSFTPNPDGSGSVIGINTPSGTPQSKAWQLKNKFDAFIKAMSEYPDWQVVAMPANTFWMPTDPVAVMEGKRLEPVRRNGTAELLPVRVSDQLLGQLTITYNSNNFTISPANIATKAPVNGQIPYQADFIALANETCLLIPALANDLGKALQQQGGAGNPAVADYNKFVATLSILQGGISMLDNGNPDTGLYNAIRQPNYVPAANPVQQATTPQAISVTFTNATTNGWAPNVVQWNTQLQYPEFFNKRFDPFLPVSMIWQVTLDPLQKNQDSSNYGNANITNYFQLDDDAIDNDYNVNKLPFTNLNPVSYDSSVVMSKKATFSIVSQINSFIGNYPDDPANAALQSIADNYKDRKILAQTMSGLNVEQMLCYYIPQIPVENLTMSPARDKLTKAISDAAVSANPNDNWYNDIFNSQAPIPTDTLALANYGPLRSGFMTILSLEIVDVFGQRMRLYTQNSNPDGSLQAIPAMTMAPMPNDTVNANKLYLAPRILTASRLWFKWLSAMHNNAVSGIVDDFVEMNSHPATSPVCGWVLPNHLDNNIFFYDALGTPIGSFGVEHNSLQYRSRAGNIDNPGDRLQVDIGPDGDPNPPVNKHLANFMWYIQNKSQQNVGKPGGTGAFLREVMQAILNSEKFINPASFSQDASLAVLIGRPLAITRAVVSMETGGNLLPLNPTDRQKSDPWPTAINTNVTNYVDRQKTGSANLGNVQFPLRLGDLANIDDGLIGYLIEQPGNSPYGTNTFFAPAADPKASHGVSIPSATNIQLTLNADPIVLTFLMDPRAAIHATTGVLPVEELSIPGDQYTNTLSRMQMTFFTMPVLQRRQGLAVPLPAQSGYVWRWVSPGNVPQIPLAANAVNSNASWDYTPQTLLEGWLNLVPDPNPAPNNN